jgi:hypothetical protein
MLQNDTDQKTFDLQILNFRKYETGRHDFTQL